MTLLFILQFISVQSLRLFATQLTTVRQASLFITNSQSPHKTTSNESVMPSNHLILCHPLLLPSNFPSIRNFFNESALCIRWPKYWSFSFKISPSLSSVKQITSPGWMHETSAQGWCTGKPQRDGMGRDAGGGIRMGNTCKSMADSCQCMAKTTTIL